MASIRLLFTTTTNPASALIRLLTWSKWSHVALVDGDSVIEARAFYGVVRSPLEEAVGRASDYEFVDLPCEHPAAVIAAVAGEIGKGYDWGFLLGFALRRNWQEDDKWACSEVIAGGLAKSGQPKFRPEAIRRVTPQHLWMLAPEPPPDLVFFTSL